MKNAPIPNGNESALDKRNYTPGEFPKRHDTVIADVLARLLESDALTSMESVFAHSTTRLAAEIFRLTEQYGWHIERGEKAVGTNDGRVAWVTAYWLPQATIAKAFELGARDWIELVKDARAKRRQKARKCKADAARINATRNQLRQYDPRQYNLWDGDHE